jgi:hypothetical protein
MKNLHKYLLLFIVAFVAVIGFASQVKALEGLDENRAVLSIADGITGATCITAEFSCEPGEDCIDGLCVPSEGEFHSKTVHTKVEKSGFLKCFFLFSAGVILLSAVCGRKLSDFWQVSKTLPLTILISKPHCIRPFHGKKASPFRIV